MKMPTKSTFFPLLSVKLLVSKCSFCGFQFEKTKTEIEDVVGIETINAISCSGKTGEGIDEILEAIINKLPAPNGIIDEKLKCLLVDSWYDSYLGVVILVRVINGKLKKNMKVRLMSNNQEYTVEKVGVFTPKPNDIDELSSGEIGFIITGIKSALSK